MSRRKSPDVPDYEYRLHECLPVARNKGETLERYKARAVSIAQDLKVLNSSLRERIADAESPIAVEMVMRSAAKEVGKK